ncbi:MAG: hypothetical protein ACE5JM_05070 [Armatimonadota bacterium]
METGGGEPPRIVVQPLVVYRERYACVPGNALRKQALEPLD